MSVEVVDKPESRITGPGVTKNAYRVFSVCTHMAHCVYFRGHIATCENEFSLPCGSQGIKCVNTYLTGLKLLELAKFVASLGWRLKDTYLFLTCV